MAAIDYEVEYNNRARVPEHAEIFARWMREAEDYRTEAMKERRAELGLAYGSTPRAVHRPVLARARPPRRRSRCSSTAATGARSTPRMFSHVARGLNAHGVDGRGRRLRSLPAGRRSPTSSRRSGTRCLFLWQRTGQRMMVYGHSAGGHLAAAMVATDWHGLYPKTPADLVPAAYSISGVFDLTPLVGVAMNQDLRLDAGRARARPRRCSGRRPRAAPSTPSSAALEFERVPAPEPDHRGSLGQGRRRHPLRGDRRRQPFHRARRVERSEQRDGAAAGRAGEQP